MINVMFTLHANFGSQRNVLEKVGVLSYLPGLHECAYEWGVMPIKFLKFSWNLYSPVDIE